MAKQPIYVQYYDSPCGELILASVDDELCLCDWNEKPCAERNKRRLEKYMNADFKIDTSAVLEQTKKQLNEYFEGIRKTFDIPLHPNRDRISTSSMERITPYSLRRDKELQAYC